MKRQKGFSFFRMASRNVVRMPARSILYLAIMTALTVTTFLGIFLLRATDNSLLYLYDNYELYATLTPRAEVGASGKVAYKSYEFTYGEVDAYLSSPLVEDYSFTFQCSMFAATAYHGTLEEMQNVGFDEAENLILGTDEKNVYAVHNMEMMREFKNGNLKIESGRCVEGGNEVVLPTAYCEENGIKIGDTVVLRLLRLSDSVGSDRYYSEFKVVGIYSGANDPAYISFEYYQRLYIDGTGISRYDPERVFVNRIDAKLSSPDAIDGYIQHLEDSGFDFIRFMVTFNDGDYNIARVEIESVKRIVWIVFLTVLFVCIGLVLFFPLYFISSRSEERRTLHALGLKVRSVIALLGLELAIVFVVAIVIGTGIGYLLGGTIVSAVESSTVKSAANAVDEANNEDATSFIGFVGTLHSDAEIKFLISYTPADKEENVKKLYGKSAYTKDGKTKIAETMYATDGNAYRIVGSGGTTGQAVKKSDISSGFTVDCTVPKNSGFSTGDVIEMHLFPPETILCMRYPEKFFVSKIKINFRIVGYGGEDVITVPFDNLLALTRYVTGSVFG